MKAGDPFNLPHFLKARTPELLQRAMLENNLKKMAEYKYFDISFVGGSWYAWYYKPVDASPFVKVGGSEVKK